MRVTKETLYKEFDRLGEIVELPDGMKLFMEESNPGDGVIRYSIGVKDPSNYTIEYFIDELSMRFQEMYRALRFFNRVFDRVEANKIQLKQKEN